MNSNDFDSTLDTSSPGYSQTHRRLTPALAPSQAAPRKARTVMQRTASRGKTSKASFPPFLLRQLRTFPPFFSLRDLYVFQGRVDPGAIRLQELAAKGGAVFAMAAVCLLLGLSLKS